MPGQRQYRRVRCAVPARAGSTTGEVRSLSRTGLFLMTRAKLPRGAEMEIEFFLPDGTYAKAVGQVRHIANGTRGEPGVGIRFLRINSEALSAIEGLGRDPEHPETEYARAVG